LALNTERDMYTQIIFFISFDASLNILMEEKCYFKIIFQEVYKNNYLVNSSRVHKSQKSDLSALHRAQWYDVSLS
jgi:hypothetical protein